MNLALRIVIALCFAFLMFIIITCTTYLNGIGQ